MDPVTAAIIAAVAAGAVAGVTDVSKHALVDAYKALKARIAAKHGDESKPIQAVKELEAEPDSAGRRLIVKEQLAKVQAGDDPELVQLAQQVLAQLRQQPGGEGIIQTITGDGNVQAINSTVNYNAPPKG